MANRKVLINRHTSTSGAPIASEMFKGEIAVAHKTGEEILWTKNNDNEMVPFISCAQTMTMINNAISDADVTYDVKAADGDAHVDVVSGGTEKAKVFTVSSKDVQSKAAFDTYSAATDATIKQNYNTLSGAIDDVLAIITTAITGDDIIKVQPTTSGAGTYQLSHKEATAVTGFNKLATDAYGHVTAATAVAASDIKTLGFEDSAWTEEKIASAITSLDSSISAVTGKYFTALAIENGKLVAKEEADIPVLEVESAGTGNVVEAITVDGHKISYTTTSVATSHDIEELSAATKSFSAGTYSEFNSAFTAINKLSADTEAADGKVFTSAKTYSDELIAALDSSKVATDNKHYITAITIDNGKLSTIGEAEIPVLASAVTGTGNVVTDIAVNDHTITFAKDLFVASDANLQALSSATVAFSGATDAKFTALSAYTEDVDGKVKALSAGTISISGFAHGEIVELSGAVQANESNIDNLSGATVAEFNSAFTAIQAMDKAASAEDGKVVTTVSEVDGVVSETKANVKDLQLGGYEKDTTATGAIAGTDTINAALSKLENKANANAISNADGSINVTTAATGTDINVNIKSGEHVLAKDGNAGLYTNIKLSAVTASSDLVKEEYALYGTDNTILGDHIKIYKDQSLVSITLEDNDGSGHTGQYLKYTYIDASGATQSTYVNVSSFLTEAEFKSGVTADASGIVHGVVDPASEKDSNNDSFLTVGADGFKVDGIKDEIDAKIAALDKTDDAAVAGQYVAAIEETDGVVAVKARANVSEAVLNNYVKGTDATAIAASDTVNQAVSKLENQVDAAKAAATTKVVEGTDAGNNMTITPSTGADGSVTYTVDLADVASATALTAEITARKAVDGQNGDTYAANTNTNFITGATSLNDADVKLDAAIKALSGNTDAAIKALDSSTATTDSGHYLTAITITDGKISAIGQEELPAATPVTTVNSTTGSTAAPVLVGIATGGTEGHQLTLTYTHMVESAKTSESADTAAALTGNITSGQVSDIVAGIENTKVHEAESADTADSAEKVAHALSVSGYSTSSASSLDSAFAFDGSEAKSLTFGTNGQAGLKSMSMTSAGVVDVEVIDCGEY